MREAEETASQNALGLSSLVLLSSHVQQKNAYHISPFLYSLRNSNELYNIATELTLPGTCILFTRIPFPNWSIESKVKIASTTKMTPVLSQLQVPRMSVFKLLVSVFICFACNINQLDATWTHSQWCYLGSWSISGLSNIINFQAPACVQAALPHPRLSSPHPQPPRGNFCCLCAFPDGPSLAGPCDAQCVVGPVERLACKPSASPNGLAPHCCLSISFFHFFR